MNAFDHLPHAYFADMVPCFCDQSSTAGQDEGLGLIRDKVDCIKHRSSTFCFMQLGTEET